MATPNDFDFGFSFADSEPQAPVVTPIPQNNDEIKALQEKVDAILSTHGGQRDRTGTYGFWPWFLQNQPFQ